MKERLPLIDNPRSDRMRQVASLGRRSFRTRKGLLRVEGPQAVRELLTHRPNSVRDVYATEAAAAAHRNLWQLAGETTRWCHPVDETVAVRVAADAQGIFAVADVDAIGQELRFAADEGPVVVLPDTADPGNLGTIIRNADAFGAAGVIACTGTADVTSPKVIRASAGSVFHLPIMLGLTFEEAVLRVRGAGRRVLGASGGPSSEPIGGEHLNQSHAWVFGNEAAGLTAREESLCDLLLKVPMSGMAESLNVGVAAGICLFLSQQSQAK